MDDIDLIKETVWNYLNGQNNRKHDLVEHAWHPDCHMFTINQSNEIQKYPRSIWKEWFSKSSDDPNATKESEILSIDIHKSAASVKVQTTINGSKGITIYTDYLNLLKKSGTEWLIVNKTFHTDFIPTE